TNPPPATGVSVPLTNGLATARRPAGDTNRPSSDLRKPPTAGTRFSGKAIDRTRPPSTIDRSIRRNESPAGASDDPSIGRKDDRLAAGPFRAIGPSPTRLVCPSSAARPTSRVDQRSNRHRPRQPS